MGAAGSIPDAINASPDLRNALAIEAKKPADLSDFDDSASLEDLKAEIVAMRQKMAMFARVLPRSASATREELVQEEFVNRSDQSKEFISACNDGALDRVQSLIDAGADLTTQAASGGTGVLFAAQGGHVEVVKLLVANGANISAMDYGGSTPFLEASRRGRVDVVQYLLGVDGVDKNATDKQGWNAVHCAANGGHLDVIKVLLESGIQKDTKDVDGQTPSDWAKTSGHTEVVDALAA